MPQENIKKETIISKEDAVKNNSSEKEPEKTTNRRPCDPKVRLTK